MCTLNGYVSIPQVACRLIMCKCALEYWILAFTFWVSSFWQSPPHKAWAPSVVYVPPHFTQAFPGSFFATHYLLRLSSDIMDSLGTVLAPALSTDREQQQQEQHILPSASAKAAPAQHREHHCSICGAAQAHTGTHAHITHAHTHKNTHTYTHTYTHTHAH
jgi:hypothetical protein